jgi:hypothetical protein
VVFVNKLVEKAQTQLDFKRRIQQIKKLKSKAANVPTSKSEDEDEEEEKGMQPESEESSPEEEDDISLPYPEECRVLNIMNQKYLEAVRFFTGTNDKKQSELSVKEYQRFAYFYHEKMTRYIRFDPEDIEDDVYTRLDEDTKLALSNPKVVRQIQIICHRKAQGILEDEEVNILNF